MKNHIFLMAIFCLISNVTCSMASIKLDKESESNLLRYALVKSLSDNYWPVGASVTLESFCCVNKNEKELEYEARFCGRYLEMGRLPDGEIGMLGICRKRCAYISATTLKKNNVIVPK